MDRTRAVLDTNVDDLEGAWEKCVSQAMHAKIAVEDSDDDWAEPFALPEIDYTPTEDIFWDNEEEPLKFLRDNCECL